MQQWISRVGVLGLGIACVALNATLAFAVQELKPLKLSSGQRKIDSIAGMRVSLSGDAALRLTGDSSLVEDGEIHFTSDSSDALVAFDNVRPSVVKKKFLSSIFVGEEPAVHGENIRLTATANGTVLFPHGPDYAALLTFNSANLKGEPREFVVHKYYKSKQLGEDEDQIQSFKLKKGYMATFAENENGSGASKVFIAHDNDLLVKRLPTRLKGKVSFIRVFPWRYTNKKGIGGSITNARKLQTQWYYDWAAKSKSSLDIEYVPMRHNRNWDSFKKINQMEDVTHLLGFNEPNQPDQANMTVEQALQMWPKLQASGLRLGSPSPNDAERGLKWLYEFMDKADKRGLRVDFITVHYYKADWSPERLIAWLEKIHKRTGNRPIWLTEFNNGAPWTKSHNPTYAENTKRLKQYCKIMDATDFVERYAIFNLGPDKKQRQVIRKGELTPTGEWYKGHTSRQGFKPKK